MIAGRSSTCSSSRSATARRSFFLIRSTHCPPGQSGTSSRLNLKAVLYHCLTPACDSNFSNTLLRDLPHISVAGNLRAQVRDRPQHLPSIHHLPSALPGHHVRAVILLALGYFFLTLTSST